MTTVHVADTPTPVAIAQVGTPDLGNHSYLATVGDRAVVIDPQRDIDRMSAAAGDASIVAVFETHVHNDYVSGGHLLAARHGADYLLPVDSGATLPHEEVSDGDRFDLGHGWYLRAIHTPGHTLNHTSYELAGPDGPVAVFSGGSMLVGAVGRSDLLGPEWTDTLARRQFRSVRNLAATLPGATVVAPTHGAGSFCSASAVADTTSTIDLEKLRNPALVEDDEDRFVQTQVAAYRLHPAYYAHMAPANLAGIGAIERSPLPELSPSDLEGADAEVIDLRATAEWAAGHVPGSLNVPARDDFAQYVGWVLPWNRALILVGTPESVDQARLQLARIGHDAVVGQVTDGLAAWRDAGHPLAGAEVATFGQMAAAAPAVVVDVRDPLEYAEAHLPDAVPQHVSKVAGGAALLPGGVGEDVWLYCATGFRAAVAAGFIERGGRNPVIVLDDFEEHGRGLAATGSAPAGTQAS